jgi:putative ABC transport system permease protein
LVIYNQLNYIQNKDIGFNRNQVLIVKNVDVVNNAKILQQEVKQIPGVINATLTNFIPTSGISYTNYVKAGPGKQIETQFWMVDEDYISTMGMKLEQGRNFSRQFLTDSSAVIINQTMAMMIDYKGDPADKIEAYHIIGVVKDFNFSSLRDNVTPLMLVIKHDWVRSLSIRVNTTHLHTLMQQIEGKWKAIAPNQLFEYSFMDDDFNALYNNEHRMGKLFVIFTSLAIIIACLGLFGLSAYAAEQRNREISIRKVLGARVTAITTMLSKDFIKLVFVAVIIATPLAWWFMQKWLQGFAYRQNIQWWDFLIAGFGAATLALITISFQFVKAALANPVQGLRNE